MGKICWILISLLYTMALPALATPAVSKPEKAVAAQKAPASKPLVPAKVAGKAQPGKSTTASPAKKNPQKPQSIAAQRPKPSWLVIPIYLSTDTSYLWEVDNPFHRFFITQETEESGHHGDLAYQVPLGDLRDVTTLNIESIFTTDVQPISLLIERYHALGVIAIIVKSHDEQKNACEVQVKVFNRAGLLFASEPVALPPRAQLDEIFKLAQTRAFKMAHVSKTIEDDGDDETDAEEVEEERMTPPEDAGIPQGPKDPLAIGSLASPVPGPVIDHAGLPDETLAEAKMQVKVLFRTLDQWNQIRRKLSTARFIQDFEVATLSANVVTVSFTRRVGLPALQDQLAGIGLHLGQDHLQRWELRLQVGRPLASASATVAHAPMPVDLDGAEVDE